MADMQQPLLALAEPGKPQKSHKRRELRELLSLAAPACLQLCAQQALVVRPPGVACATGLAAQACAQAARPGCRPQANVRARRRWPPRRWWGTSGPLSWQRPPSA